ncbi:MAG: hypothetical protein H7259_06090 [Cytophagales bacterium]|nr:hypothetical protein [Cytophaga sp.]
MKTLTSLFSGLMLCTFVAASVQAQTGTAVTTSNYKSQKVSDKGVWTDENGVKLGTIEPDGTLKDTSGVVFGKVTKNKTNPAVYDFSDKEGRMIGTVMEDGTVKDMNRKVLYTVSAPDANGYCKVYDASGKELGVVHKTHKHKGAAMMHHHKKSKSM